MLTRVVAGHRFADMVGPTATPSACNIWALTDLIGMPCGLTDWLFQLATKSPLIRPVTVGLGPWLSPSVVI